MGGLPIIKKLTPEEQILQGLQELHYRLNVAFECMKVLGLTEEQMLQAQEKIRARLKLGVQQ